jgi:hypothetical protein
MRLGVKYDFQVTNRRQGRLPVRAAAPQPHSYWSPRSHTVYDSELARIDENTTTSILIEKSPHTTIFLKTFNMI